MDGITIRQVGHAQNLVDIQIGLDGTEVFAYGVAFVGLEAVQRQLVLFGEQADGGDAELRRRPHDADGDLASVGDQELLDGHDEFPPPG